MSIKMSDAYIHKAFGESVEYIELADCYHINSETLLTIVYRREYQIPDAEITLRHYLSKTDEAVKK